MQRRSKIPARIVAFTGIDGSGKTTLSERLREYATAQGMAVGYAWCRHESASLIFVVKLLKQISQKELAHEINEESYASTKQRLLSKTLVRSLYQLYVFLDYIVQIKTKLLSKMSKFDVIILDRYILDVVADVMVECDLDPGQSQNFLRLLTKNTPKATITFLVLVPESVSLERKNDIVSRSYIVERLRAYEFLEGIYPSKRIDGTRPLKAISTEITTIFNESIPRFAEKGVRR